MVVGSAVAEGSGVVRCVLLRNPTGEVGGRCGRADLGTDI